MRYWYRAILILVTLVLGAACGDLDDPEDEKRQEQEAAMAPDEPSSDSLDPKAGPAPDPRAGPGPRPESPSSDGLSPDSPGGDSHDFDDFECTDQCCPC